MDESSLVIRNASQDLFLEALKTVPLQPQYATLEFVAEGIREPWPSKEDKDRIGFIESCRAKGVIPFSTILFEPKERVFVPSNSFFEGFRLAYDSLGDLVKGGKIHTLKFKTNPGYFELFMDKHLGQITGNGYEISKADLALTTYRLTGYNEGTYEDTQLFLEENNKIRLSLGGMRNYDEAEGQRKRESLEHWFRELSKKAEAEK